ncbi:hypothetical protein PV327_005850 [Microctonus hyperodae]|uniref:Uncharacterized protein n=1 Tax=Microctonus hyperodae TaxID=165561 RepID=A0AA39G317_MICHY|nr:hypothetical protein PV327_005850 [Microctonus hyperodae]
MNEVRQVYNRLAGSGMREVQFEDTVWMLLVRVLLNGDARRRIILCGWVGSKEFKVKIDKNNGLVVKGIRAYKG